MKQLLHTCESYIVAGFNDRAFLLDKGKILCELLAPCEKKVSDTSSNNDAFPNEIQAVAVVCATLPKQVWCAVSRYNKTLSLYCIIDCDDNTQMESTRNNMMQPTLVHRMAKRALCLAFGRVLSEKDTGTPLDVIIAGDLIGDATAFSLRDFSSKLLLGHTASMLTGVEVVGDGECILTCDRDEKIRISSFPQTSVIRGYLFGHTAYVACMDVSTTTTSKKECCIITCSGDGTVRLWDYVACQQVAVMSCEAKLPTRVAMSPNGTTAAVIYDACTKLDILSGDTLQVVQSVDCPTQPLSIRFVSEDRIVILCCEPDYMIEYSSETKQFSTVQSLQALLVLDDVTMPSTILEIDQTTGQVKLQKLNETRGGDEKPWNKVERVQKAKEASSRRSKRRRQQPQGETSKDE
jgi:tRNA (guanine-N(7)-)-methyltransferase subunit TRM82